VCKEGFNILETHEISSRLLEKTVINNILTSAGQLESAWFLPRDIAAKNRFLRLRAKQRIIITSY
jgi:hypothetical protein